MSDRHMATEIAEQPALLRKLNRDWEGSARPCREQFGDRRNLVLVGRGSSGNACTFASYVYSLATGRHPIEFRHDPK